MQVKQTEQSIKASVVFRNLMTRHVVDCFAWLQDVVIFAIFRHKAQVLVVVVLKQILSDHIDLGEAALSVKLNEVFLLQIPVLVHIVLL